MLWLRGTTYTVFWPSGTRWSKIGNLGKPKAHLQVHLSGNTRTYCHSTHFSSGLANEAVTKANRNSETKPSKPIKKGIPTYQLQENTHSPQTRTSKPFSLGIPGPHGHVAVVGGALQLFGDIAEEAWRGCPVSHCGQYKVRESQLQLTFGSAKMVARVGLGPYLGLITIIYHPN